MATSASPNPSRSPDDDPQSWVPSKAGFHGYCIWVRPNETCECQAHCKQVMEAFSKRFPPLLLPTWQPHICLVAGITDEDAALSAAKKLAAETNVFHVTLCGAEVDGENEDERATIYFSWQRLRAAWIAASAGPTVDANGNDSLGISCMRARELMGEKTQTVKFSPHLSLVYFDKGELDAAQRSTLKCELESAFSHGTTFTVDAIHVAKTDGTPKDYKLLASFSLAS